MTHIGRIIGKHIGTSIGLGSPGGTPFAGDLDTWHKGLVDIECDNIIYQFDTPLMLLTFDEGYANVYTGVEPMLTSKGLVGTLYLTTGFTTSGAPYMTWANALELHGKDWSVSSHSETHANYTTLSGPEITTEETNVDAAYVLNSIPVNDHMAYPFGAANATAKTTVETYGRITARGVDNDTDFTFQKNIDQFYIPCYGGDVVSTVPGLALCKGKVDLAVANKSAICFNFHDCFAGRVAGMEELVDYALALGVDIITIDELKDNHLP